MKILLTGAGGDIGRRLRPMLREIYGAVRVSDREPLRDLYPGEEFIQAELADPVAVGRAMEGIDGVVHLGGFSVEGPWQTLLKSNIEGCYNVFEAARAAGVQRVVFASSNHAVGFYTREQSIDHTVSVRPDSRYGVTKAFGEALGAMYADKFGLRVTCLRIGNVGDAPIDRRRLSIWLHAADLMQLVRIGLEHPDVQYEILYGASDNARAWWDNRRAHELGYRPQARSEDFAAQVLDRAETPDAIGDRYQGGAFCSQEFGAGPASN